VRLAEQHKRLTEKNPNRRGYLNFDRENLTRNIGGETRIADKLRFFMLIYSQQTGCKEKRSQKSYLSSCLLLVFAMTAFCNPQPSVIAAGIPGVQLLSQTLESDINILYVSSIGGSDTGGNGSDRAPFKTLTYALSVAPPKTAILLAPGTYSAQSGEKFPLMLRPSVTVQGNPHTRGQNIVIKGGGDFISPTSAGQNITILGADGAGLSGVTVTNTNYRGYALWIESSSPTVVNNTFSGSTHDGISVVGTSRPTIGGNFFSKNGANGITIFGSSRPEVRDNVFENTGFGVNVAQNASPLLIGNKITRNKDGVVVQADARPVLRNNYIESNQRDGIVAIARALPDLGTAAEPGGNVIRNNGQYDVNNAAKGQVIPAYGNQLLSSRTTGSVDVAGTFSPPAPIGGSALQLTIDRPPRTGGPDTSLPVYTPGPLSPRVERAPISPPEPRFQANGAKSIGTAKPSVAARYFSEECG
jgi:parallel beta-helix repeat protein